MNLPDASTQCVMWVIIVPPEGWRSFCSNMKKEKKEKGNPPRIAHQLMAFHLKRAGRQMDQEVAGKEVGEFRKTRSSVQLSSELFLISDNNRFVSALQAKQSLIRTVGLPLALFFFFGEQAQTHSCMHTHSHFFFNFFNEIHLLQQMGLSKSFGFTDPPSKWVRRKSSRKGKAKLGRWLDIIFLSVTFIQTRVVNLQVGASKCWWYRTLCDTDLVIPNKFIKKKKSNVDQSPTSARRRHSFSILALYIAIECIAHVSQCGKPHCIRTKTPCTVLLTHIPDHLVHK